MNAGMKMMMLSKVSNTENGGYNNNRGGQENGRQNRTDMRYDRSDMRREMRSGMDETRSAYDTYGNYDTSGTYGTYNGMNGGEDMESRFRDRQGRERYDDGRFAPRNDMYDTYEPHRMNMIGFSTDSEVGHDYHSTAEHREEKNDWHGGESMKGYARASGDIPFNKETAEEWTRSMKNEDGTKGAHWTMEQVKQVMAQRGIGMEPWAFFAILNAIYSDYSTVFKKYGVGDKLDFYVDMTKAWLDDKDAVKDKAAAYYRYVVKH